MKHMTRRALGLAGFALLLVPSASFAQQPPPVRVRGTVEAVDGPTLTVKSRDGQTTYKVRLTDNAAVRGGLRIGSAFERKTIVTSDRLADRRAGRPSA
jgi:hypothetical protein